MDTVVLHISVVLWSIQIDVGVVNVNAVKLVIDEIEHSDLPMTVDQVGVDWSGRSQDLLTMEAANGP